MGLRNWASGQSRLQGGAGRLSGKRVAGRFGLPEKDGVGLEQPWKFRLQPPLEKVKGLRGIGTR